MNCEIKCRSFIGDFLKKFTRTCLHAGDFIKANDYSCKLELEITTSVKFAEETAILGEDPEKVFATKNFSNFKSSKIFNKKSFNRKVTDSEVPEVQNYDFRKVNAHTVCAAVNYNLDNDLEGQENGLIKTFMPKEQFTSVVSLLAKYWSRLDETDRTTAHMFVTGFDDHFKYEDLVESRHPAKQEKTKWSKQIQSYLDEETTLGRVCKIDQKNITTEYMSSKILSIKEDKIDNKGKHYIKVRYVYNNIHQNEILKKTGFIEESMDEFYFTTINVEALLLDKQIFERLLKSSTASSYDKSSYYRQWRMSDNSLKLALVCLDNGSTYADLNGRMGSAASSIYATMLSNLADKVFNLMSRDISEAELSPWSITNQDDSLLLNIENVSNAIFKDVSKRLGLVLNDKKEQINSKCIVWCGLEFNFEEKSIQLREKRRLKILALSKRLTNAQKQELSRRDICTFLGCIFSARPIIAAQYRFLSPLCFYLRKNCFLHQPYYSEKDMNGFDYKKFYDEKVELSSLCFAEIQMAAELATAKVKMRDAREGLGRILNLGKNLKSNFDDHTNLIFVDAANDRWGIGLRIFDEGVKYYSFAQNFDQPKIESWNINIKEMYACLLGIIIYRVWLNLAELAGKRRNFKVVLFCDNEAAKSIILGQKVSCRSLELGVLLKIYTEVVVYEPRLEVNIKRIPSSINMWADRLSRDYTVGCLRGIWPNIYDLLSGILSRTLAQEYNKLLKYGVKNKTQSTARTGLDC